jgi:hypothetical protein
MTSSTRRKSNGSARPIRTERDYMGAASVAKQLLKQPMRETTAELRLQALIKEMDKFEALNDDAAGPEDPDDDLYDGPHRRWSDDSSDPE